MKYHSTIENERNSRLVSERFSGMIHNRCGTGSFAENKIKKSTFFSAEENRYTLIEFKLKNYKAM